MFEDAIVVVSLSAAHIHEDPSYFKTWFAVQVGFKIDSGPNPKFERAVAAFTTSLKLLLGFKGVKPKLPFATQAKALPVKVRTSPAEQFVDGKSDFFATLEAGISPMFSALAA